MSEVTHRGSVLHVIAGLSLGGAEVMLTKLVRQQMAGRYSPTVATLEDGPLRLKLEAMGVEVHVLPKAMFRQPAAIASLVKARRPVVLQSWMYRADLVSGLAMLLGPRTRLIWSVRASQTLTPELPMRTHMIVRLNSLLSHVLPDRIIACGDTPRKIHESYGFARRKMRVVPNGFDLETFQADSGARSELRNELGIPETAPIVCKLARLHPVKDFPTLMEAIEVLDDARAHFLFAGAGVVPTEPLFIEALSKSRHRDRIHLLGARNDPERLWATADIGTLSSSSEGFPNSIGEAMCCGVPCVATDVGETAVLIGNTGRIVPSRDPAALARGWRELLALTTEERRALGRKARQRMETVYGIESVAKQFERVYDETLANAK